jgi:hypothetical protein
MRFVLFTSICLLSFKSYAGPSYALQLDCRTSGATQAGVQAKSIAIGLVRNSQNQLPENPENYSSLELNADILSGPCDQKSSFLSLREHQEILDSSQTFSRFVTFSCFDRESKKTKTYALKTTLSADKSQLALEEKDGVHQILNCTPTVHPRSSGEIGS